MVFPWKLFPRNIPREIILGVCRNGRMRSSRGICAVFLGNNEVQTGLIIQKRYFWFYNTYYYYNYLNPQLAMATRSDFVNV